MGDISGHSLMVGREGPANFHGVDALLTMLFLMASKGWRFALGGWLGIAGAVLAVLLLSGNLSFSLAVLSVVFGVGGGALWQWGRRDAKLEG